jgi:NADH dehydrogenase/NADH:ubiquinone oxidoreductase subunit G
LSEFIELSIDGQPVKVPQGTTILDAAKEAGIDIPVLCYFAHTTANGLCRLCVVENEEGAGMQAACVTAAQDGAKIQTRSETIDRARKTILEMLASTVDLSESPELEAMLVEYKANPGRFSGGRRLEPELIDDNPVYIRDYAKCVMCWRCVQVCAEDAQYAYAINFGKRGFETTIATFFDKPIPQTTCVFCGQCVGVCPTGALKAKREHLFELGFTPEEIFGETKMRGKGKRSKVGPRLEEDFQG